MKKAIKISYSFAFAIIMFALAFFAFQGFNNPSFQAEVIGKNTFEQSMVQADGSEVHFYASGDQYFNYLHDKDGYILLRDNGYLVYANNKNGRPVPTKVKYVDNSEKVESLEKMSYSQINFATNQDLITDYPASPMSSLYESAEPSKPMVNIVIYISFAGETINLNTNMLESYLNGPQNSLTNYYQQISYGKILVNNINPITNEQIYIYQDSQPRSYYQLKRGSSSRQTRERNLLNAAVTASRQYFDLEGLDIDSNDDGYVDAVNFLISGSPYSSWGGMLWPHSWDLDEISNSNPATIKGLKVKKYSFNFLEQLTVGLLTHEFGHVLGVPDLYHYDDDHAVVGNWDLMHYEAATPQYMTSHLRYKYLKVLEENQIGNIEFNGTYTLKPVTLASKNDIVCYRINTDRPNEYFMVEYRNNNVTNYDSTLPGSGLIVYRVRKGVTGNASGKKESTLSPDEVYVFRPNVVTSGTESVKSLANLNKAYLSPNNIDFSSVGASLQQKPSSRYDASTIYYTDGANSGISINTTAINDAEISFEIRLSGQNNVDDDYFDDKISVSNTRFENDSIFSGIYASLNVDKSFNTNNLNNIIAILKNDNNDEVATLKLDKSKFVTSYASGLRSFPIRFVVNNKGNENNLSSVFYENEWLTFEKPTHLELYIVDSDNDYILLANETISESKATWEVVEMTNVVYKSSISASLRSTIAIREDGRAFISSAEEGALDDRVIDDVISASAGVYHILYIKSDLKVASLNNRGQDENLVGKWANIIKVAAGEDTSYGLSLSGDVYCAGNSAETGVADWQNMIDISAGRNHIVGLKSDGTVQVLGSFSKGETSVGLWENIVAITAGDGFTAGLKKDGTVVLAGDVTGEDVIDMSTISSWSGIKKIVAGERHLLAINKEGRVFAAGFNEVSQCEVSNYYDIIDIAAGYYHSVLLREDGKVLYAGANTNATNNITQNLKYYNNDYKEVTALESPFDEKIIKKGTDHQLEVMVLPMNATYKKVTFASNAPDIISVTSDGYIIAKAEGIATITATHRGSSLSSSMQITVIEPIVTNAMIGVGESHSVVLNNTGTVFAQGSNAFGQLDTNMWGNIKYIAAGGNTTVGITPQGRVLVAGEMADMGAENWKNIEYVATSGKTIVGINLNGTILAVGDDNFQQVSDIAGRTDVVQASVSATHSVLLVNDGTLIAEGENNRGQLNVDYWRKIIKIAAGDGYTLGLQDDGTILYAGYNNHIMNMSQLSSWIDITDISAGRNHIAGVDCNGKVYALGNNSVGQINVQSMEDIGFVSAGGEHTIGIRLDGTISGVGRNNDSRLVFNNVEPLPFIGLERAVFESSTYGVRVGKQIRLNLSINPYNATDRNSDNTTYSSANSEVATIDSNGYVTGIATGTVVINVKIVGRDVTRTAKTTVHVYESIEKTIWIEKPAKTVYSYQERLDLLGGRIKVDINSDGSKNFVTNLTKDMITDFESATNDLGTKGIIIKVDESECSLNYDIKIINTVKNVIISNSTGLNKVYDYGDEIDLSGGWIQATRANGTLDEPQTMISLFNKKDPTDGTKALEVIADTYVMASTIVTLRYTDLRAKSEGINNVHYLNYEIDVFDKVMSLSVMLDKTTFNYGEEVFGNGQLIINMKSGNNIIEDIIQKEVINEGEDSVITISNYDKYMMGAQEITINYYNIDFDISAIFFPKVNVEVVDNITEVVVTSMMLGDAAVYDTSKEIEQSITARVTFAGGAAIDVGYDGDQQMFPNINLVFENYIFDIEGFDYTLMNVNVKSNTSGAISYVTRKRMNIKVLGFSNIIDISFQGGSSFNYGKATDLTLLIKTAENTNGFTIEIDDSRLGIDNTVLTTQVVTFSVMGKTATKSIIFTDYVVGIYTPFVNVSALIGQPLKVQVTANMASGAEQVITNWIAVGYNKLLEGQQQVTISYLDTFYYDITVTVNNAIDNIVVISSPKTNYMIHESIDLSKFSVRITRLQGSPEIVNYSVEEFSVTGYDMNIIGKQLVIITYNLTGDCWEYYFEVKNKILRVQIDLQDSRTRRLYTLNEDLKVLLTCIYENGDRMDGITDGFTSNFDKTKLGRQVVNIEYWGQYRTVFEVEVIDAPSSIKIKVPEKKYYQYGESLNLEGGMIIITTQTGDTKSEYLNAYSEYLSEFNSTPTTKGSQTLTFTIPQYNISTSFIVRVKDKASSDILNSKETTKGINIDSTNARVILEESLTLANFSNDVESYGNLHFKIGEGYIDVASNPQMLISSNIKVEIKNDEGILIETYRVYVKGDASGDGKFDEEDLPLLAQALLLGIDTASIYADLTGDRMYTLTDYIKWVEKAAAIKAEDEK